MKHYCGAGKPGRTLAFRLKPGTDLMEGLKEVAEAHGIKAAYIPVIIGGVNHAKIVLHCCNNWLICPSIPRAYPSICWYRWRVRHCMALRPWTRLSLYASSQRLVS